MLPKKNGMVQKDNSPRDKIMKEEVFTGNVNELLEHVTDNEEALAEAQEAE